jgi:hypothetical protein
MNKVYSFPKAPLSQFGLSEGLSVDESELATGKFKHLYRKFLNTQNILIALALMCIVVLCSNLVESGFFMAMCIFVGIFLMPVFSMELRQDKYVLTGYWFVIFIHQIIGFNNNYLYPTFGGDGDAAALQMQSERFAMFGELGFELGALFLAQVLGMLYRWFGASHLLGTQLSILTFALSCVVLMKLIRLLGIERYKLCSLLIFGSLPTMALLGSVTIREPYQLLFFMLSVFFGLKMHLKGGINTCLFAFIMSTIVLGFLHKGLIFYGIFLVALFLIWNFRPTTCHRNIKKIHLAAFAMGSVALAGFMALLNMKLPGHDVLTQWVHTEWLEYVSSYRDGIIRANGRATYDIALDMSSYMMAVYSGLRIYIYYLFAPFPWQVDNLLDIYAVMESVFRMILICFSVSHWRKASGSQKRLLGLMLFLFLSITFLFALGTSNYGTAMRHHMLDWWIIIIVGVPPLITKLSAVWFEMRMSRHKRSIKPLEVTS